MIILDTSTYNKWAIKMSNKTRGTNLQQVSHAVSTNGTKLQQANHQTRQFKRKAGKPWGINFSSLTFLDTFLYDTCKSTQPN